MAMANCDYYYTVDKSAHKSNNVISRFFPAQIPFVIKQEQFNKKHIFQCTKSLIV